MGVKIDVRAPLLTSLDPPPPLRSRPALPWRNTKPHQTQISDEAKEVGRASAKSLNKLVEEITSCQACTRFPELEQYVDGDLPTSFDWRDYGAVTLVKNQVRFFFISCE